MSALNASPMSRLGARLRRYRTRRHMFVLALALVQAALLGTAAWLVGSQIESGPLQVFGVGLLVIMAAVVVLSPGSAAALVFIVGCGLCYLLLSALQSEVGVAVRSPAAYHVLGLAAALFLVHAVDSLRETLPADAAIEPEVLLRWVRRVAEALVPGLLIGGLLVAVPTAADGGEAFWLVGAVGLLLAVGLPAIALRPRPWSRVDHLEGPATSDRGGATVGE